MTDKRIIFRDRLNEISPSFCAAKWNQVTLHLQTGHTHSCHHPKTHKIPQEELKTNPSALHNTSYKKLQRKKMLDGIRPAECEYCWKIEDSGVDAISDRTYKSMEPWAAPYIDTIKDLPWDHDVLPTYLEVSFSSVCNFKCSYCGPQYSTKWMEEIEQHGPYPTSQKFGNIQWIKSEDAMPIPHKDENPYVEAFWKWWPDIYKTLLHFRITGGEPLLTKDTFKILDYVIENPNPNLDLSINSNMCPPPALLDKFIEKVKIICNEGKVRKFKIFTSVDAHGTQAEYIRDGLDYDLWIKNIRKVLDEVPTCAFTIMSTYNALSVFSYTKLLDDVLDIKQKYSTPDMKQSPMLIDIPYLRFPQHQAVFVLPKHLIENIRVQTEYMQANTEAKHGPYKGFFQFEVDKLSRIYNMAIATEETHELSILRDDFVKFVDEHDRRRGTNFLETFPLMADTYHQWKSAI